MRRIINIIDKLPRHSTKRYGTRSVDTIRGILIHHSATSCVCGVDLNLNDIDDAVEQVAKYHVEHNGWPGFGYGFVIPKTGEIYKTNKITTVSYHAGAGQNTIHLGICLLGNFETEKPTEKQWDSLKWLVGTLQAVYPNLYIKGHREVRQTKCPGKNLFSLLPNLS